jgi:hypothetical protein
MEKEGRGKWKAREGDYFNSLFWGKEKWPNMSHIIEEDSFFE